MNTLTKIVKHLILVSKHKWLVFKYSVKAGIPFRGLLHDLSKFSPTEFWESVKFYDGHRSPINGCREKNGYSRAWLHHKGRNKHHLEYWEDQTRDKRFGVFMPYKYIVEAICDRVAASKVYNGKNWTNSKPYEYWINIEKNSPVCKHPATIEFIDIVLKEISDCGVDSVLNRKFLKSTYKSVEKKWL